MYLTVVIPVRNEEECICQTLEALVRQEYPKERYELIVIDGRSTDGTRSATERFMREHPEVQIYLLDNPGQLSSRARNIGVRAAQGCLIAVIDGHVYTPNGKLFRAMERFKETHHALCLARPAPLRMPAREEGMPFWIALARESWLGHSRKSYIYSDHEGWCDPVSSGFAYDRRVFDRVGYFDESFDAAEDVEFHYRLRQAGIEAFTSPDLTIYSYPRTTLRGLFRQMVRYGIGRARFLRKHPSAFTKETLIPPAVFLLSAALPVVASVSWWLPWLAAAYAVPLVAYWLALLITGFSLASARKRIVPGVLIALAVWTTHMGLGWGFLKTALLPERLRANVPAAGCHMDRYDTPVAV